MVQTSISIGKSNMSFVRRIFGGILGRREIFSEIVARESKTQDILTYILFFVLNYCLSLLFIYILSPMLLEFFFGEIALYLFLLIIIHLVVWLFSVSIYHVLCKIAGGKTTIKNAYFASAYVYPLTSLLIASLCLTALLIRMGIYLAMFVPLLLFLFVFCWRIFVVTRFASTVYEIPFRNALVLLFLLGGLLLILALLVYFGINVYINSLKSMVVA